MLIEYHFYYRITFGSNAELSITSTSKNPTVDFAQELQAMLLKKIGKTFYKAKSRPWITLNSGRLEIVVNGQTMPSCSRDNAIFSLEKNSFKRKGELIDALLD